MGAPAWGAWGQGQGVPPLAPVHACPAARCVAARHRLVGPGQDASGPQQSALTRSLTVIAKHEETLPGMTESQHNHDTQHMTPLHMPVQWRRHTI